MTAAEELQRRHELALLVLADPGRPPRRAVALVHLALTGATVADIRDLTCRACGDRPTAGTYCAGCGLQGEAA